MNKTKLKAAGWRIGTETRASMVKKSNAKVPGVGTYVVPTKFGEGPKIAIHLRTDNVDQAVKKGIPGPGAYDLQNSPGNVTKRAPSYSLGSGIRSDIGNTKRSAFIPGPGNYSARD